MCSSFVIYAVHKEHRTRQEYWSLKTLAIFMTSLQGKNEVEVKIENSMHNYNATLVHCYHTLVCQCSTFYTYAIHTVVPIRVLIAEEFNYFITSLRGKNEVQVKF